jgi:hypothetical protein
MVALSLFAASGMLAAHEEKQTRAKYISRIDLARDRRR